MAAFGFEAIRRHWPRPIPALPYSGHRLQAALAQLLSTSAERVPEFEVTTVDGDVRFTYFVADGNIEIRLDALGTRPGDKCAMFERASHALGHVARRPDDDDLGARGEITTTLGRDPATGARHASTLMKEVAGILEGTPVCLVAKGFDSMWDDGVKPLAPPVP